MSAPLPTRPVFRRLRARLLARRFDALEPRLRLELLALTSLVGAFLFWQMRIAMDGILRAHGAGAVARFLALRLALLVVAAAVLAGTRLFRSLRKSPPGPAWLSLPLPSAAVLDHLGWEARLVVLVVAAASPGMFAAAWGLLPAPALLSLVIAFAIALAGTAHAATFLIARVALLPWRSSGRVALARALSEISVERVRVLAPARWQRTSPAGALIRKDARLVLRRPAIRWRLVPALFGIVAAAVAWQLPIPLDLARFAALALSLLTAWQTADALLALSGADPYSVLRGLPVGALLMWSTRTAWALLLAALIVLTQALAAHDLSPHARALFLTWTGIACFVIALLAVHYGITLFPRADVGGRLLTLSLSLAMIASLMIPLLGWLTLLTAVLHSARRVPEWARLEAVP